jgi:hypothetical protein
VAELLSRNKIADQEEPDIDPELLRFIVEHCE